MATQAERRAETRNKIIQAAKRLFDKHGFELTSVDQIVTGANVAKGTFYQYYETKVDVLADVARDEGAEKEPPVIGDGCQWQPSYSSVGAIHFDALPMVRGT
ncbi:MAG: TetR/AcrR family transcriptional regulator [Ferrovum myxofaciens]|uniref:TetR/AcrR family transcriptional regulator n=1 Tax=Ferrovum myxofaciens TaxID=416213 RepID=UPI001AF5842C|nr:TetR/AcrR family transcriptional regulator [Ferrovum myxofaciens]QKE37332.1 MAG: TetR/AcrR family transcriptional regulator [Ferrovum myxofaciens]QWY74187.1 MAG: TetR/AcrR family transcriptional regulator [Ferrovum myxofaciens]